MQWIQIITSTEIVRVRTDEIVYISADGNYSDIMLSNGQCRKMTFQLHYFDSILRQHKESPFERVGRSLIVNKRYVFVVNLTEQKIIFSGASLQGQAFQVRASRDAIKQFMEILNNEKGGSVDE
jgi:DNA-binding LytR/AlgR family response regulator